MRRDYIALRSAVRLVFSLFFFFFFIFLYRDDIAYQLHYRYLCFVYILFCLVAFTQNNKLRHFFVCGIISFSMDRRAYVHVQTEKEREKNRRKLGNKITWNFFDCMKRTEKDGNEFWGRWEMRILENDALCFAGSKILIVLRAHKTHAKLSAMHRIWHKNCIANNRQGVSKKFVHIRTELVGVNDRNFNRKWFEWECLFTFALYPLQYCIFDNVEYKHIRNVLQLTPLWLCICVFLLFLLRSLLHLIRLNPSSIRFIEFVEFAFNLLESAPTHD